MIRIADNKRGITEEVQRRGFAPFFIPQTLGRSTGLGLSLSYQIVDELYYIYSYPELFKYMSNEKTLSYEQLALSMGYPF